MTMIKYDRIYGGFIDVILFGDHVDCGLFFLDLPYFWTQQFQLTGGTVP